MINHKYKFIGILFLSFFLIGWTKLSTSLPNNSGDLYIDRNNSPTSDEGYEFWVIQDFYIEDEFNDISTKSLVKYDCTNNAQKIILFSNYKTHMAEGKPRHIFALDKPQWFYPKNDSQASNILKEVCSFAVEK